VRSSMDLQDVSSARLNTTATDIYKIFHENYVEQNAVFLEYLNFCKVIYIKNLHIHPKYYDKGHGVL